MSAARTCAICAARTQDRVRSYGWVLDPETNIWHAFQPSIGPLVCSDAAPPAHAAGLEE